MNLSVNLVTSAERFLSKGPAGKILRREVKIPPEADQA